jgi:hypothetical protein
MSTLNWEGLDKKEPWLRTDKKKITYGGNTL